MDYPEIIPEQQKIHLLRDTRLRPLQDLRISVTDRCNFRCVYCMPKKIFGRNYLFLPQPEILNFEEIARVVRLLIPLGLKKVRLTGGEPLLRKDLHKLITALVEISNIELVLTTNGSLLCRHAKALKSAGLERVTVSLDALNEQVFKKMNDVGFSVQKVLDGIDAASKAGLNPIKVNTVVKRSMNASEIIPLAQHFRGSKHILRFIEFMDVGTTNGWRMDDVVPSQEIINTISKIYPLEPIGANAFGEVAKRWRYSDGCGEIGVISSVTQTFCNECTRLRLSTDGRLFTCLFAQQGLDIRTFLRDGTSDALISQKIEKLWQQRTDNYSEQRHNGTQPVKKVEMSYIGG